MTNEGAEYRLRYAPEVEDDLREIGEVAARRVLKRIASTLPEAPNSFGKELRTPLASYRRLRAGQYRVIYRVLDELDPRQVWVLVVGKRTQGDRRDVYRKTSPHDLKERTLSLLEELEG